MKRASVQSFLVANCQRPRIFRDSTSPTTMAFIRTRFFRWKMKRKRKRMEERWWGEIKGPFWEAAALLIEWVAWISQESGENSTHSLYGNVKVSNTKKSHYWATIYSTLGVCITKQGGLYVSTESTICSNWRKVEMTLLPLSGERWELIR